MLITWYKLNGDLLDSSGNGKHGLGMYGNPTFVDGIVGKCLSFDGIDDYLDLPANPELNTDRWTISMWINVNLQNVGTYLVTPQSDGKDMSIRVNTVLTLSLTEIGDVNTRSYGTDADSLVPGKWNLVTIILDDTVIKFYINGVLQKSVTDTGLKAKWSSTLKVGTRGLSTSAYFKGLISDIRIYDHCLSDKEIYDISKALCLHYTFDDVEEPTVNLAYNQTLLSYSTYHTLTQDGLNKITMAINSIPSYLTIKHWFNPIGKTITASGYLKLNGIPLSLPFTRLSTYQSSAAVSKSDASTGRFEVTQYYDKDNITSDWLIHAYLSTAIETLKVGDIITIEKFQVEEKDHATPFVNGTRDNVVVRDKSDYGNDSLPLTISTTPAFINDCKIGKQSSKFGVDNNRRIENTSLKLNGSKEVSFAFLVNPSTQTSLYGRLIDISANDYNGNDGFACFYDTSSKKIKITRTSGATSLESSSSHVLDLNTFYHVCVTLNGTSSKIYINGELSLNTANNLWDSSLITTVNPLTIGQRSNATDRTFVGSIDDLRIYKTALTADDVKEIYQSRANLDDKGNLKVGELVSIENKKRIIDYSVWNGIGAASSFTGWRLNGMSANSNLKYDLDPFGKQIIVWECKPDASNTTNGGWNNQGIGTPDITKKYRYSIWVKRSVIGSGNFYLGGPLESGFKNLLDVVETNPYFFNQSGSWLNSIAGVNKWILIVGYVYPASYSGTVSGLGESGVWIDKAKYSITKDFKWEATATKFGHRAYLFYANDNLDTRQEFCYPRIDLCDGTEPSIEELLNGYDSRNYDLYMQKGNVPNVFDLNEKGILTTSNVSEIGVTDGLVAWYPLNGDTKDYSGNGNDGTVYGATVASGLGQKCYQFDGVDDYISLGNVSLLKSIESFSIDFWAYLDDWSLTTPIRFISCTENGGYNFSLNDSRAVGFVSFQLFTDGTYKYVKLAKTSFSSGWHKITGIYNKESSLLLLYVDGTLVGSVPCAGTATYANNSVFIAAEAGSTSTPHGSYLNGKIQDVRIYNRALTPEEVMINYNLTKADKTAMIQADNGTTYLKEIKEI